MASGGPGAAGQGRRRTGASPPGRRSPLSWRAGIAGNAPLPPGLPLREEETEEVAAVGRKGVRCAGAPSSPRSVGPSCLVPPSLAVPRPHESSPSRPSRSPLHPTLPPSDTSFAPRARTPTAPPTGPGDAPSFPVSAIHRDRGHRRAAPWRPHVGRRAGRSSRCCGRGRHARGRPGVVGKGSPERESPLTEPRARGGHPRLLWPRRAGRPPAAAPCTRLSSTHPVARGGGLPTRCHCRRSSCRQDPPKRARHRRASPR